MANMFDFYLGQVANFLGKGLLHSKNSMSIIGVKPLYDRIMTKSSVKKVLMITEYPMEMDFNLVIVLNRKLNRLYTGCKVIMTTDYSKSNLHNLYRTSEFRTEMSRAYARFEEYDSVYSEQNRSEKELGKEIKLSAFSKVTITKRQHSRLNHVYKSFETINSTITNQGTILDGFSFIEVIAPDNKTLNKAFDTVYKALESYGFGCMPIHNNNFKYLSHMSPSSFSLGVEQHKAFTPTLMTGTNISYIQPYNSYGFIGDGTGTPLGIDLGSNAPFVLNFFSTADRQINMFLCPSGKGKTFETMYIVLFLLNQLAHCSVIDVKGDEWNPMLKLTKGIEIDLLTSFINTTRLDDIIDLVDGDMETSKMFYANAIDATSELLYIMSGYSDVKADTSIEARFLIGEAVKSYFNQNNVVDYNYKSFSNTKTFNYKDIVESMFKMMTLSSYKNNATLIQSIITNCSAFMSSTGLLDKREITIRDVLESPLVIYSLGRNRNQNANPIMESINTFMISYMDMKKIYIRKRKKLQTVCIYEELQRVDEFARLIKFINGIVTGARSSNVTVFLLCNNPSTLQLPELSGIRSNVSTYFVGPYSDESDLQILKELGLSDIVDDVKMLALEPDKYNHCFVSKFDTGSSKGSCIFSALATDELKDVFASRDVVGG